MNRWQASLIHFGLSLVVFVGLLAVILLVWYPGILFDITGGWDGLRIVIGVDLVLGPLLTLIVFKADKPSLKFDLSSIALFQFICLAGGVWIVYNERPVVLALEYDTIYSLSAREFSAYGNSVDSLKTFQGPSPKAVYIELPQDDIQAATLSIEKQLNGEPLFGDASNYLPLYSESGTVRTQFRREAELLDAVSATIRDEIDRDCVLSKFVSVAKSGLVCFDSKSLTITDYFEE
ncbi:MAG: hypothetical protein AB8B95_03685 [Pseudohongiellaceae bacterium]